MKTIVIVTAWHHSSFNAEIQMKGVRWTGEKVCGRLSWSEEVSLSHDLGLQELEKRYENS
jgi:hypothetical protein